MLVAFEGIDGCGKGTQTARLVARAKEQGLSVETFSFPRYGDNAYSATIARYLNGEFGGVNEVPPEFAALLYAGDRLAACEELQDALQSNDLVVCDRYVPSNLAHQAAKLPSGDRQLFLDWLAEIEYDMHQVPRADVSVLLKMPVETAVRMVARKHERSYTPLKADIHEADEAYLRACAEVYERLRTANPQRWIVIDCMNEADALRDVLEIADAIWSELADGWLQQEQKAGHDKHGRERRATAPRRD